MIKRLEKLLSPIDKQTIDYTVNTIKKWAEKQSKEEVFQGYIECMEWYLAKECIIKFSFAKLKADLEELENLLYDVPIEDEEAEEADNN